jgi:cytochrome c peroxidase
MVASVFLLIAAVCFGQALTRQEAHARARDLAALGRRIFFDEKLSGSGKSGKMSCASCHDPRFAYGAPEGKRCAICSPCRSSRSIISTPK